MEQAPMQGEESAWKLWSLGAVVADKPDGVDVINVNPYERLPLQEGAPAEATESYESNAKSTDGVASIQAVKSSQVIQATWCPDGDNHLFTSPMVRANEIVKIYKYADKEEYFWTTIFRSPEHRRLERIVWGAGNLSGGGTLDIDSIYFLEFNTITKAITLRTSLSDGEEFQYEVCLNPGRSQAWVTDHIGNNFMIDSPTNNVILEDVSGGRFETRDGHPKITGTKGILLSSPSNVVEGPTEFKDSVIVRDTFTSVGLMTMNSGMAMESGNGGSGGTAKFEGNLHIIGDLTVTGTSLLDGYVTFGNGHN